MNAPVKALRIRAARMPPECASTYTVRPDATPGGDTSLHPSPSSSSTLDLGDARVFYEYMYMYVSM